MSVQVTTLVWGGFPDGGSHLLCMLALADYGDHNGQKIFPSMETIARKMRLTESQARRVLHRLVAAGYVEVIGNKDGGKPGSTRNYRIRLDRLTGSANGTRTPSTDATSSSPTGSIHAQGGVAPMRETGSIDATQSVREPSLNRECAQEAKQTASASHSRIRSRKAKTSLPEGFEISESDHQWAKERGYDQLDEHLQAFKLKARANDYRYADWSAAFRNAVRADWAGLRVGKHLPRAAEDRKANASQSDLLRQQTREAAVRRTEEQMPDEIKSMSPEECKAKLGDYLGPLRRKLTMPV